MKNLYEMIKALEARVEELESAKRFVTTASEEPRLGDNGNVLNRLAFMKGENFVAREAPQWRVTGRNGVDLAPIDISIPIGDHGLWLSVYFRSKPREWRFDLSDGAYTVPFFQGLLPDCKTIEEAIIEAQAAVAKYLASLSAALGSIPLTVSQ